MKNHNAIINSDYGPIIINVNDSGVGKSICQSGYWANDDIEIIKTLIQFLLEKKEIITFYDVGANIGTHSLALSKTFKDRIKIRAFEAQRQIFNMMCGTIAINGLSNIHCYNVAVSNKSGEIVNISLPDYANSNNFGGLELISPLRSDNQNMIKNDCEEISTITLDYFNEAVDFIKMDIEGMEDKAFVGAMSIMEKHKPICFVEILKTDINYLVELFKNLGYLGFQKNADLIAIPSIYNMQINGLNRIF